MKESPLSKLVGARVKEMAEGDSASLGLLFDNGSKLSIYNDYKISIGDQISLTGKKLVGFKDAEIEITLTFEDIELSINLENSAWKGPEAIELLLPNNEIVVWN